MLTLQFTPFPTLSTERFQLRELLESDVKEIYIQRSHPTIQKYIKREPARNEEDALAFIRKVREQELAGKSITWVIVPKGEKALIGQVCLWNIEPENDKAELGYSLHPDWFNKGVMTEVLRAIIDYGFSTMKLQQIDAFTHKDNLASRQVLHKSGFVRNTSFEKTYEDREEMEYNTIYTLLENSGTLK